MYKWTNNRWTGAILHSKSSSAQQWNNRCDIRVTDLLTDPVVFTSHVNVIEIPGLTFLRSLSLSLLLHFLVFFGHLVERERDEKQRRRG